MEWQQIAQNISFIFRCLLDWANPGCLGSYEEFDQNFAQPIYLGQRFTATKRELATARKSKIYSLTFPALCISENCFKIKINWNFHFHTSLWCLRRFYEGLMTFAKPFEAPQRSMEIKILVHFLSSSRVGTERIDLFNSQSNN